MNLDRKTKWLAAFVLVSVGASAPRQASAEDVVAAVVNVVGCSGLRDDKERLTCFDKAVTALKTAGVTSGPETANTKELVAAYASADFKVVDPDDIHVAPKKFIGKPIEIRNVKCFYADKNDYRCIAPSRGMITAVFAEAIGPGSEREPLESECGAIKKLDSPACRKTIHVVPTDYGEDAPNAFAKRIILKASNIEIQQSAKGKR